MNNLPLTNKSALEILDFIGDGISIQDTDFKISFQNKMAKKMIGDHIGEYCYSAFEHRDSVCSDCPLALCFNDGISHTVTRTNPVSMEKVEITASPLMDSKGKIIAGIEVVRNLTARSETERELEIFKFVSAHANDAHFLLGRDAKFSYVNATACSMFGYSEKEFLTLGVPDVDIVYDKAKYQELFDLIQKEQILPVETINKRKDNTLFPSEITVTGYSTDGKPFMFAALRDIAERKEAENALIKANDELDTLVKERTSDLEETNTALKVLLQQIKLEKSETEENILSNMKNLVFPYISRLKKSKLRSKELDHLNTIESNLKKITSGFSSKLSSRHIGLTPKMIKIAKLIQDGKQAKDISETLNISLETVKTHIQNIRKKLGLYGTRTNLRSYLLSLFK